MVPRWTRWASSSVSTSARQEVVGGVDVVVDRVELVPVGLHRVGRGALLGEVDDRVGAHARRAGPAAGRSPWRGRGGGSGCVAAGLLVPERQCAPGSVRSASATRRRARCRSSRRREVVDDVDLVAARRRGAATSASRRSRRRPGRGCACASPCRRSMSPDPHDAGTLCPRAVKRPSDPRRAADSSLPLRFPEAVVAPGGVRASAAGRPTHDEDHQLGDDRHARA